ncbi:MAG: efflux RND transporter permease subunit, partial [Fibrobacterales bacterium]
MANTNNAYMRKGPIAWMAKHTVASNLLMVMLILGGVMAVFTMKQEVFPEFDLDMVTISVPYPGATPEEVEQGIVLVIEERVRGIDGVKSITSTSSENVAAVMIELQLGQDANKLLADIKNEIDRITSFPEEIEEPTVALASNKQMVLSLLISGGDDLKILHNLAEQARSELLALDGITQVALNGVPPLEIEVAVSQSTLEGYGLTLNDVAAQIRMNSVELGGGSLDTERGKIMIKVAERKRTAAEFSAIPIRAARGGTEITLGDIATITDGYAESDRSYYYNDERVVELKLSRVGSETPEGVSTTVKEYLKGYKNRLPENISVTTWNDQSILLSERIDLLVKNAALGLVLVMIILGLFLQRKLALWVALGIPISFLGAFLLMSWAGVSINMITLFALIVTLGMVVDDAIVVAENVYHKLQNGVDPLKAAIDGTLEMSVPVTFSILTTVAAFSPMLFVPGMMGKIFFLIPAVVILVLLMSLLECYFILPAHLSHSLKEGKKPIAIFAAIDYAQEHANAWLTRMIEEHYQPFVTIAIKNRWLTFSIAFALLVMVLATVPAGIIKFSFFPKMEGNSVTAEIRLPFGVPLSETESVRDLLV